MVGPRVQLRIDDVHQVQGQADVALGGIRKQIFEVIFPGGHLQVHGDLNDGRNRIGKQVELGADDFGAFHARSCAVQGLQLVLLVGGAGGRSVHGGAVGTFDGYRTTREIQESRSHIGNDFSIEGSWHVKLCIRRWIKADTIITQAWGVYSPLGVSRYQTCEVKADLNMTQP